MPSSNFRLIGRFASCLLIGAALSFGVMTAAAQVSVSAPITPPAPAPTAADMLAWDSLIKEQTPEPGKPTADFVFKVTNTADYNVVIGELKPSCGCTTAKLPSNPWVLLPHTNAEISVSVNLAGKSGAFTKTVAVYSTNHQIMKTLTVRVTLPENVAMMRARNNAIAMGDPQAIFKGDCAKCHVEPTRGLMGKPLYVAACGICHEAKPRATMVPDLHALNHPTFYGYWKMIITDGKPHSMMPGFSTDKGGPLSEAQIDSIAKVLSQAISSSPAPAMMPGAGAKTNAMIPAAFGGAVAMKH